MALIDLWRSQKTEIEKKQIQQLIAIAGDGQLKDGNGASQEFREFLTNISTELIYGYANQCLETSFNNSGFALQDLINQMGERLGFDVTYGRYRGIKDQVGYDGLWKFPSGHTVIAEVKTTDAYRIDLDNIANYRKKLISEGFITEKDSSALIIVGRKDTGDLEAQIRGSRHAWDMRLIGVDALASLLILKENVEDPETLNKIHEILIPREFTKLDDIIEIVFSTAEDVKEEEIPDEDEDETIKSKLAKSPKFIPVSFHAACQERISLHLSVLLLKKSKTAFATADNTKNVICLVSKEHNRSGNPKYWFAFHPHQKEFLEDKPGSFVAFGCGDKSRILLLPSEKFLPLLAKMNVTETDTRFYWHVHITRDCNDFSLHLKKGNENIKVTDFLL